MATDIARSIDSIIREGLAPRLKAAGFRKRARTFRRAMGEEIQVVNVQGSQWNAGAEGSFTLNLGVYYPAAAALLDIPGALTDAPTEPHCLLRSRIGRLMPARNDHWWKVDADTDHRVIAREVAEAWDNYGAPWLDEAPDVRGAGDQLASEGSYYYAAVAALAAGDRQVAAERVQQALARYSRNELARAWGVKHRLIEDAPAV